MKLLNINILNSLFMFLSCTSIPQKEKIKTVNEFQFPTTLFVERKKATLFKEEVPFIYLEFLSDKEGYGYMGYPSIKGNYFDECWKFNLYKSDGKFYSDYFPGSSFEDTSKNRRVIISNFSEICIENKNRNKKLYQLNILPKNYYNEKKRNLIYAFSVFEALHFPFRNKINCIMYESTYLSEPIFNLYFKDFSEKIDSMSFKELRKVLHIKNKYPE